MSKVDFEAPPFTKGVADMLSSARPDGIGVDAIKKCGLSDLLTQIDSGSFGTTVTNLLILDYLAASLDLAFLAEHQLVEKISVPETPNGLTLKPLSGEERRLTGLFFIRVFCHFGCAALKNLATPAEVEGALSEDGIDELAEMDVTDLAERMARLLAEFVRREHRQPTAEALRKSEDSVRAVHVFLTLLDRAAVNLLHRGRLAQMGKLLDKQQFTVANTVWVGLEPVSMTQEESSMLRPVTACDIVGNREYLEAGLRLARDIAGYDFDKKKNPKLLNPILFALGRPGCGKTLVAHAVGNAFLEYCKERHVPAKFTVIRKSDWASSYQNASAANLVRMFKELYQFHGVAGIYWADIDTALASRDQTGLRSEEKANLSAAFNIFDGTLIPFDGKWFMICDANNLEMDEALRTRIAKNPFHVMGPENAKDYARLLREILLSDFSPFLDVTEREWDAIGDVSHQGDISGRGMEGISRQVIDRIQDFEYPDEYYRASFEERSAMMRGLSKKVNAKNILSLLDRYIAFEKQEEERRAKQRFDDAVKEAVFELNVRREVVNRITDKEPLSTS